MNYLAKYILIINFVVGLIFFCTNISSSQNTISDTNNPEQIVRYAEQLQSTHISESPTINTEPDNKCGLWLSFTIARNWNLFSESQKKRLNTALTPTQLARDTVIGYFRIHFDTSGYNEPALVDALHSRIPHSWQAYVDSVGKYFNHSLDYMVNNMRYLPPPFETGQSYYNIYIEELGSTFYGETRTVDQITAINPILYSTFIRIDNDYLGFISEGIAGLKVTSAHELHHAVQLGNYGLWQNEIYFYEITSTWMEDVIYNDVNDYYQYLKDEFTPVKGQFSRPYVSFTSSSPLVTYSRAIWGKFIEKRFSRDVMKQTWEYIRTEHCLNAIDHALTNAGSSFRNAFLEWAVWNNNTGTYCDTISYYTEGRNYPVINYRSPVEYSNAPRSFSDTIEVLSSAYHPICLLSAPTDICNLSPQMFVIITNLNMIDPSGSKVGFSYDFSNTAGVGYTELSNHIFVRLNSTDPENWASQESVPKIISDILAYPNPFYPKGSKPVIFKLPPVLQSTADLYIFSSNMNRIAAHEVNVISQNFEPRIEWDGHDMDGNIISSGVYFYVIYIDGKQLKGKLAVIRE